MNIDNDTLAQGFSYPLQVPDSNGCLSAHRCEEVKGSFPFGCNNQTWHGGIHLVSDGPVVAAADGEVVAYRFVEEEFTMDGEPFEYSNSFVLCKHLYKSVLGNTLEYYSLYMHLDPRPEGESVPPFLCAQGYEVAGRERPVPGQMLFDKNTTSSSRLLVPKYSIIEKVGKSYKGTGHTFQEINYTTPEGEVINGLVRFTGNEIGTTDDGKAYIKTGGHSLKHTGNTIEWKACKGIYGIKVCSAPSDAHTTISFIRNGTTLTFKRISDKPGWAELISPLPNTVQPGPFYIKISGQVKTATTQQLDTSKLGALQIPEPTERPPVSAGDVLGAGTKHFLATDKKFFHFEIFTLQKVSQNGSVLDDPKGERFFAQKGRYVIPAGRTIVDSPLKNVTLNKGDYVTVINYNNGGEYVKVQVTGLVRTVQRPWLEHKGRKFCDLLNKNNTHWYIPGNIENLNNAFCGWVSEDDILYLVYKHPNGVGCRDILLPCAEKASAQVWIKKDALGTIEEETNKSRLKEDTQFAFADKPQGDERQSSQVVTLDNPELISCGQKQYARLDEKTLVDISGVEPQTPFTWAGFECLFEDPANHDAFVDFEHLKTIIRLGDGKQEETETCRELTDAITNSDGTFDINKIYSQEQWKERLSHLIIRSPSEWQYCDEKYKELGSRLGIDPENPESDDPDLESILNVIKKSAFWDELKEQGVFEGHEEDACKGEEVYQFHPVMFLHQISQLNKCGLSPNQKEEFFTLVCLVRGTSGDRYFDAETCKAIGACLFNRLEKYEWSAINSLLGLSASTCIMHTPPSESELSEMLPYMAEVYKTKSWERLPSEYVHFHPSSEQLSAQPWDITVLDTDNTVSVGGFKFYKYKSDIPNFATDFTIKELKVVSGGDKGQSLPARPGTPVSIETEGEIRPYRYDLKASPEWQMEFSYTISNTTAEMERFKQNIKWLLRYEKEQDGKTVTEEVAVSHSGNMLKLKIPADITGYSVELVPVGGVGGEPICNPFPIALRKKETLLFNGSTLKWLDETGQEVPFAVDGNKSVDTLKAFTGSPDLQPPLGQDKVNEGPIPEGIWWLRRDNLQCIDGLCILKRTFGNSWPGGVERWGRYRLWLEPDNDTNTQGRSNLCILGNESGKTGGNIHIWDGESGVEDMVVFKDNFVERVEVGGRLKLRVNYAKTYKKGDTGNDVLEINFRLAGFGGVLPDTEFTDLTEKGVKQFQRDYMGMTNPSGIVDLNTLEAIDEFCEKYHFEEGNIECPNCSCGGYGTGQFSEEKGLVSIAELNRKYEYPGIHRSLIWVLKAIIFYLEKSKLEYSFTRIYSGYRCWVNNENKNPRRTSTNHMGKAFDLHFNKSSLNDIETIRDMVIIPYVGAQIRWSKTNKFSLEPSRKLNENSREHIATSWIHIDVRSFDIKYLRDEYFTKNYKQTENKRLVI